MSDLNDDDDLLRFLAQFGIVPDSDGQLDPQQVLGRLQGLMGSFGTQLAGFGPTEGGMNWGFTRSIAQRTLAQGGNHGPSGDLRAVRDAVALADLWLDDEIAFPRIAAPAQIWSPKDWIDNTFATWQELLAPVVTSLSTAIQSLVPDGGDGDTPMPSTLRPMVKMAATGMLAAQVGQALGRLAGAVLSAGELGLPLTPRPLVALLPANIDAFGEGLDVKPDDVMLFLTLREAARQRLFGAAGWLGPQLLALVTHYARDIAIDPSALEDALRDRFGDITTMADMERAGDLVAGTLFSPAVTPEQKEVLERLETLLALVEGWVDDVVEQVTKNRMPAATALMETLRRRRASGGPAQTALKSLIGLDLQPRRTRDAANTWAATRVERGSAARDGAWHHPDFVPTPADLDDPLGFAEHDRQAPQPADDFDDALSKLLDEEGD